MNKWLTHTACHWILQELATFTHSCKKCLTVIERNHQSIQKIMNGSKTLQHMDMSLLQKRVGDLQASSQVQETSRTVSAPTSF